MNTLESVAKENNLELIDITSERNGYPRNLRQAAICHSLSNFEEVESLAKKYGLEIIEVQIKQGWSIWYDAGWTNGLEIKSMYEDKDFYSIFTKDEFESKEDFIDTYGDSESITEEFIDEIWSEIETLQEGDFTVMMYCEDFETVRKHDLFFSNDSNSYSIALVESE